MTFTRYFAEIFKSALHDERIGQRVQNAELYIIPILG